VAVSVVSLGTDSTELLSPWQAGLSGPLIPENALSTSEAPPRAKLSHLGFHVRDLDAQADFYKRVFSLVETDRSVSGAGDPTVLLTGDSAEHHQLVLTAGLPADAGSLSWPRQCTAKAAMTNPSTRNLT
jgi:hypothetical protein